MTLNQYIVCIKFSTILHIDLNSNEIKFVKPIISEKNERKREKD